MIHILAQASELCDYNPPPPSGVLPSWLRSVDERLKLDVARSRALDAEVADHSRQLLFDLCTAMTRVFGGLVGQASAGSKAWWAGAERNIDALLAFLALECGADEGRAALHAALADNGESASDCGDTLAAFLQELSGQAEDATEGFAEALIALTPIWLESYKSHRLHPSLVCASGSKQRLTA